MLIFPSYFVGPPKAYEIEQSLRFNSADSNYMERTFPSSGSLTTWTFSCWFKHGKHSQQQTLWSAGTTFGVYDYINFSSDAGTYKDNLEHYVRRAGATWRTSAKYRDDSAWYHVVAVWDTTNATAADRLRHYINGVRVDSYSASGSIAQNATSMHINTANKHRFGLRADSNTSYTGQLMDGYMAELNFIDGIAVNPDGNLGEFDDNGVWRPIKYTGSYGSNGVYLKFDPSATNGIGHDHSGNGNNFTATSGFSTSGTGTDVMSDTPTTNYMTLNPLDTSRDISSSFYLSNANLDLNVTNNSSYRNLSATFWPEGLKGYFEVTISTGTPNFHIGFTDFDRVLTKSDYTVSNVNYHIRESGKVYNGPTTIHSSYLSAFSSGDTLGVAFDFTGGNRNVWFSKNGTFGSTSGGAGNPAAGTNPALTTTQLDVEQRFYFAINTGSGLQTISLNAGQRDFEDTPPTGFKAVNTSNLPAPTVKDGSDYFNTILWAGDNANPRTLTGVGFQPDWVWLKDRTQSTNHRLVDAVRGAGNTLKSNLTSSETSSETAGTITAFTSDGFSVEGTSTVEGVNLSGDNYVAWNWLAGGSGSSNTDGSITSTVSVNATAGFSIVTYTGTGANATVGHGLGVGVDFILIKSRSNGSSWQVGHSGAGWTKYAHLDLTNAFASASSVWQDTAPTSTVFSLGNETGVNGLDRTYVAYCFAEVEGYSKFGSYTGNGSTDGVFIYTGFKVGWWMVKRTDNTEYWYIRDTTRDSTNAISDALNPNASDAEGSYGSFDFLSNGIKIRESGTGSNTSGGTYIYAAFAENPFGGSGVSPATAR